jgi:hypothetical protein
MKKKTLKDTWKFTKDNGTHPRKSMCTCGHVGDAPFSAHSDTFQAGHGKCLIDGCKCRKFTWKEYI